MSVGFKAVQWSREKLVYDAILLAGVTLYIGAFIAGSYRIEPPKDLAAAIDVRIRAFGTCAFFMLTIILSIGPLARLHPWFRKLLFNRRHFGVLTFIIALLHAWFMIEWYEAQGNLPNLLAELTTWSDYAKFIGFPFKVIGFAALLLLFLLAATSHDFWLSFLSPPVWKWLHMTLYVAYGLVVLHVALGIMQYDRNPLIPLMLAASFALVTVLHLVAGWRERARRSRHAGGRRRLDRRRRAGRDPGQGRADRCRRRAASASRCSATAPRSARSPISARTRTGRSARAASSTAASPVPGTAGSIGCRTGARRRRSPRSSRPIRCESGTASSRSIRTRCRPERLHPFTCHLDDRGRCEPGCHRLGARGRKSSLLTLIRMRPSLYEWPFSGTADTCAVCIAASRTEISCRLE